MMLEKVLLWTILLDLLGHSFPSGDDIGSYYLGKQSEWNLAFQTCQENHTRLPKVKISESDLLLADTIPWNPNECVWIGATYELITNYTYGTFPAVCCGTISKKNNNYVRACDNCDVELQFLCEADPNSVSNYKPRYGALPWTNASKECSEAHLLLPNENNSMFSLRVSSSPSRSPWWINERRFLNLSPVAAKNGDIPLCFCNAPSTDLQCFSNVKTYCLPCGESLNQKSSITENTNIHFQSDTPAKLLQTGNFYSAKDEMGWKGAYQTCHANSTHLPRIDNLLCMMDPADLTKCFWIEATYDTVDVNGFISHSFLYPTYCCGRAGFVEGMFIQDCADCSKMNSYLCVQDFNNGTDFLKSSSNNSTWAIARDTCKLKGGLPDQNTTEFQNRMGIPPYTYWINDLRALNIAPVERNGKYSCAYWNKGKVEFGSCDQHGRHIETFCIHDQTSVNDVNCPTVQSQRTYQTTSVLQVEETSLYLDDREISQAKNESNQGIGSILGGTLGAFVVIIIVAIVIFILLKRRRIKNGNDALLSSTTENASKVKIMVSPKTNDSCDTILGGSLVLKERSVTSNQMSTAQNEEPVIYAQPQKDKKTSRNLIDNKFNITQATDERENIGLYSMVQKGQKEQEKTNSLMKTEGLDKELGNGESFENMYNTVNFHRPEFQDERTVNVYDKANFRFDVREVESGNTYDDERLHHGESSNYDTTDVLNSTTDSTYDHLK